MEKALGHWGISTGSGALWRSTRDPGLLISKKLRGRNMQRYSAVYSDKKKPRARDRGKDVEKYLTEDGEMQIKRHGINPRETGKNRRQREVKPKKNATGTFFSARSLEECNIDEEMRSALLKMNIEQPSHIQAMASDAFLEYPDRNLLIADHAGSGKTLAYLMSIIQKLREDEKAAGSRLTKPLRPRVIITAPTAELVAQVTDVCRAISKTIPFRSAAITGGRPWRTQKKFLEEGVDVVVGTPQRLLDHIREGTLCLDACQTAVLDEVDVLLGETFDFRDQVLEIIKGMSGDTQFAFVTATVPEPIYLDIQTLFSNIALVMGPGLHRSAPGATQQVIDCSGGSDVTEESGQKRKMAALLSLLQNHISRRTLVFCNKIETCRMVENFLKRNDRTEERYVVFAFHSAIAPNKRESMMDLFMKGTVDGQSDKDKNIVLVCTDRASRGLDTAQVDHVILFDFPRDPSEYVRRIGRTARGASSSGLVSVLVLGRQVKLAQKILNQNEKGLPIHSIPTPDI